VRGVEALAQFSVRYKSAGKKEGVFQGLCLAKSDVEKRIAEIGPLGLVLAAKRCMVSIRCGYDKRISICEGRNEDARIAGRNDYDLISYARLVEHLSESGWLKGFSSPSRCDSKTVGGAVRRKDEKQDLSPFIFLASAFNVAASVSIVAPPPFLVLDLTTTDPCPNWLAKICAAPVASRRKTP